MSFTLRNIGHAVAKGVVVDIVAYGCREIAYRRDRFPDEHDAVRGIHARDRKTDPNEHVYVEYVKQRDSVSSIRQRIRQVGIGGNENLIRMGFRVPVPGKGSAGISFTVHYEVMSEYGLASSGDFSVAVTIAGEERLSRNELEEKGK
jgi:hypothetical protein